jgi:para-nitrobenzyl esterase
MPAILAQTASSYLPDVDGRVLTESVGTALAAGRFNRVPLINGTNHDEYRLFVAIDELLGSPVTAANYRDRISSALGVSTEAAAHIAEAYPLDSYPSPAIALGAVGTDAMFACPALTVDRSAVRYVPVHAYEFSDEDAPESRPGPHSVGAVAARPAAADRDRLRRPAPVRAVERIAEDGHPDALIAVAYGDQGPCMTGAPTV